MISGIRHEPALHPRGLPVSAGGDRRVGLFHLGITVVGWGFGWPVMKLLLEHWPPLFARGMAGVVAGLALLLVAAWMGENLSVPRQQTGVLLACSMTNVFTWMGFPTVAMLWLSAGQGALLVYTVPIWVALLTWVLFGRAPGRVVSVSLLLGISGVALLMGPASLLGGGNIMAGTALALGAAFFFALGTVTVLPKLRLDPVFGTAAQLIIGCVPMLGLSLLLEEWRFGAAGPEAYLFLLYLTVIPMGLCYLTLFSALRRLPATYGSIALFATPMVGVLSGAAILGEPFGVTQAAAICLTFSAILLALRAAPRSSEKNDHAS